MRRFRPRLPAAAALAATVGWLALVPVAPALARVPAAPALARSGQPWRGYVANTDSGTVSVINTATNAVITTIAVGDRPCGIQLTPDARRAYVANTGSDTVSVLDTASGTVTATVDVGTGPAFVAISPDGSRVYVTNNGSNTVSVLGTATNRVVATIPVGAAPIGAAVSPDGRTVYVANQGAGTVSVVDAATTTVTGTIEVGAGPADIAVAPDGRSAYVTNNVSGTVSVIDTATSGVTATVPVGAAPIGVAVSPDGRTVYVGDSGSDTVSLIDTATRSVRQVSPAGSGRFGVATTPDGARVYVADANSAAVSALDADATGGTIAVGATPTGVAITPDQAPRARLAIRPAPAGQLSTLDASASTVEFGTIASYRWNLGDGTTVTTTTPVLRHRYAAARDYPVTVTLTSSGGTSTAMVFTGRTVSRNGGSLAVARGSAGIPEPVTTLAVTGEDSRTVTALGALVLAAGIALLLFGRGKPPVAERQPGDRRPDGPGSGRRYAGRHTT